MLMNSYFVVAFYGRLSNYATAPTGGPTGGKRELSGQDGRLSDLRVAAAMTSRVETQLSSEYWGVKQAPLFSLALLAFISL